MSITKDVKVGVVIPCYRVGERVLKVIETISEDVDRIYVVDDGDPERAGDIVEKRCSDPRVVVLRHPVNRGVGAAVKTGYRKAMEDGMNILVKMDGDGQMDGKDISRLIYPILIGEADYTKGNRFFNPEDVKSMPKIRLFGNAVLSFLTKVSSGYWNIFDPTNGFTALHAYAAKLIPWDKVSESYFFESDMLFRLNTIRAVVVDVPMKAYYGDEESSLKIPKILGEFLINHTRNFIKRVFYNYYLRDMSLASLELPIGLLLFLFGLAFGSIEWWRSFSTGTPASAGTVMLAALPLLLGVQLILSFLSYDIASIPVYPIHKVVGGK